MKFLIALYAGKHSFETVQPFTHAVPHKMMDRFQSLPGVSRANGHVIY